MAVAEPGDLVGAVTGVADEDEPAAGEADQHQSEEPAQQLGRGPVRTPPPSIILLRVVQVDQHRQGPGAGSEGEADQHGQDDPPVPVSPGGVAVGGADRFAVPGLAVDHLAGVAVDGVVADEDDRAIGDQVAEYEAGQGTAEVEGRPGGSGEDTLVVGAMSGGEPAEGAREVGDGATAGGQDGGEQEGDEPAAGRLGEGGGEFGQQRDRFGW